MKIYCLYYKDTFVVAFPNREDCVNYGKKNYEGMEWDCSILVKYLQDIPSYISNNPIPYTPIKPPYETNIWPGGVGSVRAPTATYTGGT